jgi:hypothetical protein
MTLLAPPKPSLGPEISPEKQAILDLLGFEPTGPEQAAFLASDHRQKAGSGGYQGGKSTLVACDLCLRLPLDMVKARDDYGRTGRAEGIIYWLVGSTYDHTRKEFEYINENIKKMGYKTNASGAINPGKILVDTGDPVTNIAIYTKSSTNPEGLAMEGPHGIIACEAGLLDFETWRKINARIAPRKGWMDATGTREGHLGRWPSILNNWKSGTNDRKSFIIPSPTNIHVYPGGYNDPEILRLKEEEDDDWFLQRIMGKDVPAKGLVFPEFDAEIHVRDDIKWERTYEQVFLWEDPGYGRSAHSVSAVQEVVRVGKGGQQYKQLQVFWQFYERGYIQSDVIEHVMNQPWWKASSIVIVSDPNYMGQHHSMGSVEEEWFRKARIRPVNINKRFKRRLKINEGTHRLKAFLKVSGISGEPGIVWSPSCKGTLSEFGAVTHPIKGPLFDTVAAYRNRMDSDGNIIGDVPEDKNNDGIKGTIYGLIEHSGYVHHDKSKNGARMKRW